MKKIISVLFVLICLSVFAQAKTVQIERPADLTVDDFISDYEENENIPYTYNPDETYFHLYPNYVNTQITWESAFIKETSSESEKAAVELMLMGLFRGKGVDQNNLPVFALESTSTRAEAVTMLVRLMGKETEAEENTYSTPFTDVPAWAESYVGYAYENKLVNGVAPTLFGSNEKITVTQYLTMLLRALNYDDLSGDFYWESANILSDRIGLTNGEYSNSSDSILRGDMAIISRNALKQTLKNETDTLFTKIFTEYGVIRTYTEKNGYVILVCDNEGNFKERYVFENSVYPYCFWEYNGGVITREAVLNHDGSLYSYATFDKNGELIKRDTFNIFGNVFEIYEKTSEGYKTTRPTPFYNTYLAIYDENERILSSTEYSYLGETSRTQYTYTDSTLTKSVYENFVNGDSKTSIYDLNGRLLSEKGKFDGKESVEYEYYDDGTIKSVRTLKDGQIETVFYNKNGYEEKFSINDGDLTWKYCYEYDENDRLVKVSTANPKTAVPMRTLQIYTYDGLSKKPLTMIEYDEKGGIITHNYTYNFFGDLFIESITQTNIDIRAQKITKKYQYDFEGNVVWEETVYPLLDESLYITKNYYRNNQLSSLIDIVNAQEHYPCSIVDDDYNSYGNYAFGTLESYYNPDGSLSKTLYTKYPAIEGTIDQYLNTPHYEEAYYYPDNFYPGEENLLLYWFDYETKGKNKNKVIYQYSTDKTLDNSLGTMTRFLYKNEGNNGLNLTHITCYDYYSNGHTLEKVYYYVDGKLEVYSDYETGPVEKIGDNIYIYSARSCDIYDGNGVQIGHKKFEYYKTSDTDGVITLKTEIEYYLDGSVMRISRRDKNGRIVQTEEYPSCSHYYEVADYNI